jgi:N-sulfoglucosamine sulfohydrolase
LVSTMDLAPTIMEVAGSPVPDGLAGRSMLALLEGRACVERDCVCGSLFYDVAYDPMHYVRTASHKYIRSFAVTDEDARGADPSVLSTFAAGKWVRVDDFDVLTSPSCRAVVPSGSLRPPREELYDLHADPYERNNLVDDPAARIVLDSMRARLSAMMEETGSPLLHGHVAPPQQQREAVRSYGPGTPRFIKTVAEREALQ